MKEECHVTDLYFPDLHRHPVLWGACWDDWFRKSGKSLRIWIPHKLPGDAAATDLRATVGSQPPSVTKPLVVVFYPLVYSTVVFSSRWFWTHWKLAVSGDIFDLPNSGGTTDIMWTRARDAAKHPTMQGQPLITKNFLTQNVNSAKVEKSCCRSAIWYISHI